MPIFLLLSLFLRTPQASGQDQQMENKHSVDYHPCHIEDISLDYIFFRISINSLGLYLSPEFSLKPVYSITMAGKNFEIHGAYTLENALNLGIFTSTLSPVKTFPSKFLS